MLETEALSSVGQITHRIMPHPGSAPQWPIPCLPAASREKVGFQVTQPEIKWQELEDIISVGYLQLRGNGNIYK